MMKPTAIPIMSTLSNQAFSGVTFPSPPLVAVFDSRRLAFGAAPVAVEGLEVRLPRGAGVAVQVKQTRHLVVVSIMTGAQNHVNHETKIQEQDEFIWRHGRGPRVSLSLTSVNSASASWSCQNFSRDGSGS